MSDAAIRKDCRIAFMEPFVMRISRLVSGSSRKTPVFFQKAIFCLITPMFTNMVQSYFML